MRRAQRRRATPWRPRRRLGGDAELLGTGSCSRPMHRSARSTRCGRRRRRCRASVSARPASTETRAVTAAGSTDSRYAASCSSNHSRHGADTTRALTPSAGERLAGLDGELHLGAGRDEDHVGRAVRRLGEHVGALGDVRRPRRTCHRMPRRRHARTPGCSAGSARCRPGRRGGARISATRTRSRWRRRGARRRSPGWRAASRAARSAGGSGRLRRARRSRASRRRSTGRS